MALLRALAQMECVTPAIVRGVRAGRMCGARTSQSKTMCGWGGKTAVRSSRCAAASGKVTPARALSTRQKQPTPTRGGGDKHGATVLPKPPGLVRGAEDGVWTMVVPSSRVGTVIGKQGSNLKDISSASRCSCTIDPEGESALDVRVVRFRGTDAGVALAADLVSQRCHPEPNAKDKVVSEEVTVAETDMGRVIGKGGGSLALIESVSGAVLSIPRRDARGDSGAHISVQGIESAVATARQLIEQQCDRGEEVLSLPSHIVSRVIGHQAQTIQMIASLSHAHIGLPDASSRSRDDNNSAGEVPVRLMGTAAEIALAKELFALACAAAEKEQPVSMPSAEDATHRLLRLLRPTTVRTKVEIPADVNVGAMIGRLGSGLQMLRRLTGADVTVTNESSGSGPRHVIIEGSPAQVSRADRAVRRLFPVVASIERDDKPKRRQRTHRSDVPKVIITGGAGNMGTKAAQHLVAKGANVHVLDPWDPEAWHGSRVEGVTYHKVDMLTLDDWPGLLDDAWAVLHLAAVNPYPGLSWTEAADSIELNVTVLSEAAKRQVPRVVFASSNHVMGGWKEKGGAVEGPLLTPDLPVLVGTKWAADGAWHDSVPYATAKIAGERICNSLALHSPATQFISLRIGWCQPGANLPSMMSAGGGGTNAHKAAEFTRADSIYAGDSYYNEDLILEWYKKMWLSNRDWQQIAERCVYADFPQDTPRHVILNANSRNTGSRWDVSETCRVLGYSPKDDVTLGDSSLAR